MVLCLYMFVLLYVHQKRENLSPSLFITSLKGSTPLSLIPLPILSVSLLHSALMSHPSYLAGKEEELRHQKTQTHTTILVFKCCNNVRFYFVNRRSSINYQSIEVS